MAATVVGSVSTFNASTSEATIPHTVPDGLGRLLLAAVALSNEEAFPYTFGATYGGAAMVFGEELSGPAYGNRHVLRDPIVGTANLVVPVVDGPANVGIAAVSFAGVAPGAGDLTSTMATWGFGGGSGPASETHPTLAPPASGAADLVIGAYLGLHTGAATPDGGQTTLWDFVVAAYDAEWPIRFVGTRQASGGTVGFTSPAGEKKSLWAIVVPGVADAARSGNAGLSLALRIGL